MKTNFIFSITNIYHTVYFHSMSSGQDKWACLLLSFNRDGAMSKYSHCTNRSPERFTCCDRMQGCFHGHGASLNNADLLLCVSDPYRAKTAPHQDQSHAEETTKCHPDTRGTSL